MREEQRAHWLALVIAYVLFAQAVQTVEDEQVEQPDISEEQA